MNPVLRMPLFGVMLGLSVSVASAGGGHFTGPTETFNFTLTGDAGTVGGTLTGVYDAPDGAFQVTSGSITSAPAEFDLTVPIDLQPNFGGGGGGGGFNRDVLDLDSQGLPFVDYGNSVDLEAADNFGNGYFLNLEGEGHGATLGSLAFYEELTDGSEISLSSDSVDVMAAPEPSAVALMLGGFALLGICVRREQERAS